MSFADSHRLLIVSLFSIWETIEVNTEEYIKRMSIMHLARNYLAEHTVEIGGNLNINFKMISFEQENATSKFFLHFGTLGGKSSIPGNHRFFKTALSKAFTLIIEPDENIADNNHIVQTMKDILSKLAY